MVNKFYKYVPGEFVIFVDDEVTQVTQPAIEDDLVVHTEKGQRDAMLLRKADDIEAEYLLLCDSITKIDDGLEHARMMMKIFDLVQANPKLKNLHN